MEVKNVKGTKDILGAEAKNYAKVENIMKNIAELFHFSEIRPPMMEHSEVFVRGVGEGSDVVRKEMYTFDDKGGRSLTLRPEFTAGIIRTIVQNKLHATQDLPIKAYYCGPAFRYERPQLGRYRQFIQFGVELVGGDSLFHDIDVISLGFTILKSLGFENLTLKINTLGDDASREAYKVALKEYFKDQIESMCPDCKSRYELNPLRILDCKVPEDRAIVKGAPKMSDYLTDEAKARFDKLVNILTVSNIPFEIDETLVRGLDYYSETVFEFHYISKKNQNYGAIGAGGHYDKLMKEFGGPALPGVGFSLGVDRVVAALTDDGLFEEQDEEDRLTAYVIPVGDEAKMVGYLTSMTLRVSGYKSEVCYDSSKIGSMIKKAVKKNAKFAIIIGENEIENETVLLKELDSGEQQEVAYQDLIAVLDEAYGAHECHCHCDCDDDCDCEDGECECHCGHHHGGNN